MSPSWRTRFRLRAFVPCVLTGALLAGPVAVAQHAEAAPAGAANQGIEHVLVLGKDGAMSAVAKAVTAHGGTVTQQLAIINGVSAQIPKSAEAALRATPGVVAVTPDAKGHLMSVNLNLGYDPQNDDGSLNLAQQVIGATQSWQAGYTGKGVDIALIDSGVSPVPGLNTGNVIYGPDLSFDSQNPNLTELDGYGHGTHMASIIAGRDQQQPSGRAYAADTSHFYGIAPDSRLVSVKEAASDGSADVSQVIAAINWVDQNAHKNGLNIRVLNLSYGTDSTQDYHVDPLAYAAEQAWRHGIVVVVSGGNDGRTDTTSLADPAYDPYVLAVGASDSNSTVTTLDDTVAPFSTQGPTTRHVDLVAPGVHVLGLRDPGSVIDQGNPSAVVNGRFFRGSGTSQAAAMMSGAVALLVQRFPNASPDQIKRQLMSTANTLHNSTAKLAGNGVVYLPAAENKALNTSGQPTTQYGWGTGSLDAARGDSFVADPYGNVLTGEIDIFGDAWNPAQWAAHTAMRTTWGADGSWNGTVWTGTAFTTGGANTGAATTWLSSCWRSTSWRGVDWASTSWRSSVWLDGTWADTDWDSTSWRSTSWRDATWADASWS